jgi:AraC-like DNA-binding protein
MICEYNERRSYYSTVMQAQLVWLLACLGRSFREIQLRAESGSYGPTISAIIEYMSDHCATATMESTAAHFHYNPSYFSRMIKKVTHSNFSDILLRLRLDRAADLLADTSLQIQEISDRTGFGSSSYFATAFKKRHGVSPAEYRRQTLKRRSGTAAD